MAENPYDNGLEDNRAMAYAWEQGRIAGQPQWRPIPDEAPGGGQYYWARSSGAWAEMMLIFGDGADAYSVKVGSKVHWHWNEVVERYTHIAGPIEPPKGE